MMKTIGKLMQLLISEEIIFKIRKIIKDRKSHYTVIKSSNFQKGMEIISMHAPNKITSKYVKQNGLNYREINKSTNIVGNFDISHF